MQSGKHDVWGERRKTDPVLRGVNQRSASPDS
jgi:hypothetical protein